MLRATILRAGVLLATVLMSFAIQAWEPLPVSQDPLVRMPGTQPEQGVTLEGAGRCMNCHAGYNAQVEPGFNWQGSMMSQSARDPFFWAAVTVAAQDSIAALGNPNATDICLRCHLPKGWLEGRSDPTNAAAMQGEDFDGVQCDFCHRNYDAFHVDAHAGTREGETRLGYWDETNLSGTPSSVGADQALTADQNEAANLRRFGGGPLYGADGTPVEAAYEEAGGGQYFVATGSAKRASFADATARHQMIYSRFHKSRYFCSSCHDVSNPILANLLGQESNGSLPTEQLPAYAYFHVERTFSEFMLSAYGRGEGANGLGPFAPDVFNTSRPGNKIAACQDCHMRDVVGRGANKRDAILRPDESVEHPHSGQPLHDLTGGNTLVPWILASTVSGSANYDPVNAGLLNNTAGLTMDLGGGLGLNPAALLAGAERARQQLELAAVIDGMSYDAGTGALSFRIQNQTGHKLISGYPEGRRIWVNVRVLGSGGELIREINPWDAAAATLKGLGYAYIDVTAEPLPAPASMTANERLEDALVFEVKMSSSLTGETEGTFHFALADGRYKDNRIPPLGFSIADAGGRLAQPVWQGVAAPDLFTADEYAGGYRQVALNVGTGAAVEVRLYYQGVSREYAQFLSDEIEGRASSLDAFGDGNYVAGTDPFFDRLRAWGPTVWQLWKHNRAIPGAAPVQMAFATTGGGAAGCAAPAPVLASAEPGHQQVALAWSDVHSTDAGVLGYTVYYDQAGKSQKIAELSLGTGYLDTGLTNGQQYCYKVSSFKSGCQSTFSNVLCAVPQSNVQLVIKAVDLETGRLVTTGKGPTKVTTFEPASAFSQGQTVALRARLLDSANQPLSGASFTASVNGPSSGSVSSASADAQGYAIATWSTTAPSRNKGGTPTGAYTAETSGAYAGGHTWDGVSVSATFQLSSK